MTPWFAMPDAAIAQRVAAIEAVHDSIDAARCAARLIDSTSPETRQLVTAIIRSLDQAETGLSAIQASRVSGYQAAPTR